MDAPTATNVILVVIEHTLQTIAERRRGNHVPTLQLPDHAPVDAVTQLAAFLLRNQTLKAQPQLPIGVLCVYAVGGYQAHAPTFFQSLLQDGLLDVISAYATEFIDDKDVEFASIPIFTKASIALSQRIAFVRARYRSVCVNQVLADRQTMALCQFSAAPYLVFEGSFVLFVARVTCVNCQWCHGCVPTALGLCGQLVLASIHQQLSAQAALPSPAPGPVRLWPVPKNRIGCQV